MSSHSQKSLHVFFMKVALSSCVFLAAFELINPLWYGKNTGEVYAENQNAQTYLSASYTPLGTSGVALSTRIGTKWTNASITSRSDSYFREVLALGIDAETRKALRDKFLAENMQQIREYLELSRVDINELLTQSSDRKTALENHISGLESGYKNAALSSANLQKLKELFLSELETTSNSIESIKTQMATNFSASDAESTLEDADTYFDFRNTYTEVFTDIVFINQFLKQYEFLNAYNKGLLDTLINNKKALIEGSYVVIPDSGDEFLKPLHLIYDEAEIKAQESE